MHRAVVLTVLLCLAAMSVAQQASHKVGDFVGTWQSSFKGQPFMTIKLAENNGQLTGSVSNGAIEVDSEGELTNATAKPGESPILSSRMLDNGSLEIKCREEDGGGTTTLVLTLVDARSASLRFVLPPSEGPSVKPLHLQKVEPKS